MNKSKAHSLTGRITSSLMVKAFKAVKKNRGAAGIDKVSIQMFEQNLEQNLAGLMKKLKNRTFQPVPLRRVYLDKSTGLPVPKINPTEDSGKLRPLGIPAVKDRVAQEVIRRLVEPYFVHDFEKRSYGFIKGRNCHQAIREIIRLKKLGYRIVLDADIKGFFDNISQQLIMQLVAEKIADGNILAIIQKFLTSGVMDKGVFKETLMGTPQGGIISPLLANIVLDVLDKELAKQGYIIVRYADDFLVMAKSTQEIEKAFEIVQTVIENKLQLKLSPEKTKVTSFNEGFDFLGFHFNRQFITMRTKSMEKIKDKIARLTIRTHNFSSDQIRKINQVTRGVANYFATDFSSVKTQFEEIDKYTRRRLRCMKKKRISREDNYRIPNRFFQRRGLIALSSWLKDSQRTYHGFP